MEPLYIVVTVSTILAVLLVVLLVKLIALSKLLNGLAEKIPGTAMTASELAEELGGSIQSAFENYVPQPAALGEVIAKATEQAASKQLELGSSLASGYGELVVKFDAALKGYAGEVENSLRGLGGHWGESLTQTLTAHAEQVNAASAALSEKLEKISSLEQNIVELLRLQEAMEGTIRELAASTEFKETLTSLRTHLAESDKLLVEAAKPRTIRLVETDGEITE